MSGASGFSSFVSQPGTAPHPTNRDLTFEMGQWDDPSLLGFELLGNEPDLVALHRNAPLAVEVHILHPRCLRGWWRLGEFEALLTAEVR
ncbi:hypothetical protein [Myxococcus sp. AB036A]|uniref:hypothetical protein n=1 Tax=Myxococcus sp. AB036A TaxID=2562793 RepID=UPI00114776AB|nr:hypothetical protein [Myxococcus sp. AB036A]